MVFLAGVLFQLYASIIMGIAYVLTGSEFIRFMIPINFIIIGLNIVPVLHLDGYRVLAEYIKHIKTEKKKKNIYIVSMIMNVCIAIYFVFMLGKGLLQTAPSIYNSPTVGKFLKFGFLSILLMFVMTSIPKWLKNPYG